MSIEKRRKFKKGAASFYIVAISTLVLLIVAVSFAVIIVSEIERTANEDLSQSAYDSAMAGVEDAKLAYYLSESNGTSKELLAESDCMAVANILGRTYGTSGVMINEGTDNNMQQAYTCVKLNTINSVKWELSSAENYKVIKAKFDDVPASDIKEVKISWYKPKSDISFSHSKKNSSMWTFSNDVLIPPVISVAMVQTGETFNLEDFEKTEGNDKTNRGMVYLVPTNKGENAVSGNVINKNEIVKSNSQTPTNSPYGIDCNAKNGDYACSATIKLPEPLGGGLRNDDTFLFVVALPYGNPTTEFEMAFFCEKGDKCQTIEVSANNTSEIISGNETQIVETTEETEYKTEQVTLDASVQLMVDSTGRANDLYRRVEVRLESAANSSNLSVLGPLGLLGDQNSSDEASLEKNQSVICEWTAEFGGPTCSE